MNPRPVAALAVLLAAAPIAAAPIQPDASLRAYLRQRFAAERGEPVRYVPAFVDLNSDGRAEALAYLRSASHCGSGGCDLLVLTPSREGWQQVGHLTVANPPIGVLASRTGAWLDLSVHVAGGGVGAHDAWVRFAGRAYPGNPSLVPAVPNGAMARVLIGPGDRARPLF